MHSYFTDLHPTKYLRFDNSYPTVHKGNLEQMQQKFRNEGWPPHSFDTPVEIIPGVFLSGVGFTEDLPKWCYENNITHIVNAAGSYGRTYYQTHPHDYNIDYLELDIDDLPNFSLYPFLNQAYDFINQAYNDQGNILIHCIWGQSRSVSCLLYFIMNRWFVNYDSALYLIRINRPAAYPNEGFERELRTIAEYRYK